MFEGLTDKLTAIFKRLRGHGRLSEENIAEALREVRLALLEADVHFKVVKAFIDRVKERALGQEVLQSLSPGQQVVKIVYDELVQLMGGSAQRLTFGSRPPSVLMLVGLHGCGKTTTTAKLAWMLRREGRRPLLVAADLQRPAAREQLQTLGGKLEVPVFVEPSGLPVERLCLAATEAARARALDPVIIDTAGRLHIDEDLMAELGRIKAAVEPTEILLVADAMTGQDAVNSAARFDRDLALTGVILTKLDGDARGGAALSIRQVTGKPIKFVGVGEKWDALEPFHPDRMASRILGMGDILGLVERAQEAVDRTQAAELERKIRQETFTLEDFRQQIQQVRKMGPLDQLLGMIPGLGSLGGAADPALAEREIARMEAIINSMTPGERQRPQILNGSRRQRVARGSGTTVAEVNRLLKQFTQTQKLMRQFLQAGKGKSALRGRKLPFPMIG